MSAQGKGAVNSGHKRAVATRDIMASLWLLGANTTIYFPQNLPMGPHSGLYCSEGLSNDSRAVDLTVRSNVE